VGSGTRPVQTKLLFFKIKILFSAQVLVGLASFVCSSQLVLYPGPNVKNNGPYAFNAGPIMINRPIEIFDPAVQQVNTPAASATNQRFFGKQNRAADFVYEPTINAAPIAKDGNGAMGPSNLAASTNTAPPPTSNRYYGYGSPMTEMYGYYGKRSNSNGGHEFNSAADDVPTINAPLMVTNGNRAVDFLYPAASTNTAASLPSNRYGRFMFFGKRSNSNGGHKFNSAADDVPTINAAPMVTNGNGAMGPSNPAASTNTAPPSASSRYYGYPYAYGYGYPDMYGSYGKRSNSNGGHYFNSAADDVPSINAPLMVTNGNKAEDFLYPAASTNTAASLPSNRGYGRFMFFGKRSNSKGGHKFNSATDVVPTINAPLLVTNGNRAVDFLYPAASTNTAASSASNRYYGYGGYGY
jgi:hypothetical protein